MAGVRDRDLGWKRIQRELRRFNDGNVFVGLQGAAANDTVEGDFTMVELASVHEFGSKDGRIPERTFLRKTIDDNREEIGKRILTEAGRIIDGKATAEQALSRVGAWAVELVRKTIRERKVTPPLSPATIERKGSTVPLIDTGRLMQSITYMAEINGAQVASG